MKKMMIVLLTVICLLTLSACGCKHEIWNEADCVTPKTCAECGEIEGAPLGHSWLAATCETAKTCENCGELSGDPLGHSWQEATCTDPKTCTACLLTEGEALGHSWEEATTEAPKTCTTCALTEGERIITDPRFTTAATKDLHGTWVCYLEMDGTLMNLADFEGILPINLILELGNDGSAVMRLEIADEEAFNENMREYMLNQMYAAAGGSKEAVDSAMLAAYDMTTEEYVDELLKEMDFDEELDQITEELVYYVEDGKFYSDRDWDEEMASNAITLNGDSLTIEGMGTDMSYKENDLTFVRVTE